MRKHSSTIVFLMEIKSKDEMLKQLREKIHLENLFIVPRCNTGGGLALYWKNGVNLRVQNSSLTFIDVVVNPGLDDA